MLKKFYISVFEPVSAERSDYFIVGLTDVSPAVMAPQDCSHKDKDFTYNLQGFIAPKIETATHNMLQSTSCIIT